MLYIFPTDEKGTSPLKINSVLVLSLDGFKSLVEER